MFTKLQFALLILASALTAIAINARAQSQAGAADLSISGTVWEDQNADGIRQPSEPGLRSQSMSLSTAQQEVRRTTTDAEGRYSFIGLDAGLYNVRAMASAAGSLFYWTYPARRGAPPFETSVSLSSISVDNLDFGFHRPPVSFIVSGLAWFNASPPHR